MNKVKSVTSLSSADFTPELGNYKTLQSFRCWCQKVLPLVYDDSLSYYEALCKISEILNEVIDGMNELPEYIADLISDEKLKEIMSTLLNNLREQIASANEGESKTATAPRKTGELVWLSGELYLITHDMIAGDQYVANSNCKKVTIEELINNVIKELNQETENRENADNEIIEKINIETENRENADNKIIEKINIETENRENADNEILNSILKLTPNYIFKDINSMVNFNGNFKVNDVIICCKNFGVWFVTNESKSEYITRQLLNGKYAELQTFGNYFDLYALEIQDNADLYPIINFLVFNGYNRIKIPKGTFKFSQLLNYDFANVLTPKLCIIGAGKQDTIIKAPNGFLNVNIKGYMFRGSTFSDFSVSGESGSVVGGTKMCFSFNSKDSTPEDMLDNLIMKNLNIVYFASAIKIRCRAIWNLFDGITCQYNNRGLEVLTNTDYGYFNQNTFINCQFDTNAYEGVYLECKSGFAVSNLFDGCSIEGNYSPLGQGSGNFSEIVTLNASASFNGCHFECGNKKQNIMRSMTVTGKSNLIFTGCTFLLYPTYLYNLTDGSAVVINSPTFFSCATSNYNGIEAVINNPITI